MHSSVHIRNIGIDESVCFFVNASIFIEVPTRNKHKSFISSNEEFFNLISPFAWINFSSRPSRVCVRSDPFYFVPFALMPMRVHILEERDRERGWERDEERRGERVYVWEGNSAPRKMKGRKLAKRLMNCPEKKHITQNSSRKKNGRTEEILPFFSFLLIICFVRSRIFY